MVLSREKSTGLVFATRAMAGSSERKTCMVESMAICNELAAPEQLLAASPWHSVTTATSLQARDEKQLITDGP